MVSSTYMQYTSPSNGLGRQKDLERNPFLKNSLLDDKDRQAKNDKWDATIKARQDKEGK